MSQVAFPRVYTLVLYLQSVYLAFAHTFPRMSMRVDAVDVAIGDVIDKLEGICAKFANFKEKREEKRSAMDEIFDPAKSESELAGLDVKD